MRGLGSWRWLVGVGALVSVVGAARADSTCRFARVGNTLRLLDDCETDQTLFIPDGGTLDGRGHRIVAFDPPGGSFAGAVVRNAGSVAHVKRLVIDAGDLGATCHAPIADDVRAILFDGASGSIVDNHVVAIHQGPAGCQEGHGIEVRGTPGAAPSVQIRGNRVQHFQKTGIFVRGPAEVSIFFNLVQGEGPIDYIAQNAIQLSEGVRGEVRFNRVSDTIYTGGEVVAAGVLVLNSRDLRIAANHVADVDVGIHLGGVRSTELEHNLIEHATYEGVALDGTQSDTVRNRVAGNRVVDCNLGIALSGAGARYNVVAHNTIAGSDAQVLETDGAAANLIFDNGRRTSGLPNAP